MTALPFSRAIVGHLLERLLGGLTQLQGAVLRALAEAQPPVFDATGPQSPLVADLLQFNAELSAWHQRLKRRHATLAADLRLQRGRRR
jgi:hypothetical protein